jgi:uncharacterized heparinase superfamily protein
VSAPELDAEVLNEFRRALTARFHHLNKPLGIYERELADLMEDRFTFLNRTIEIDPRNWNRRYGDNHLWSFHLHYFDYALRAARVFVERKDRKPMRQCQNYIERWIKQTGAGLSDGWEPYPTSLRIVNWIYVYVLIAEEYDDQVFLDRLRRSIFQQLDYLGHHMEYHLLGNHLLKNIKAMIIGNLFFGRKDRLSKWERLLWREFGEQVLEDGGHYERSPMYHAQALADLLECFELLRVFNRFPPSGDIVRGLCSMAKFLDAMSSPDGKLVLFNDAANTEETRPGEIIRTAVDACGYVPGPKIGNFKKTGYYVWASPFGKEKIYIDAGDPSVAYNMGHAHCDLLSYELWLGGKPFIVDPGVHGYGGDAFREYSRSTRAHNTVMFDDNEQLEIWGVFRVARRAKFLEAEAKCEDGKGTFNFWGKYRSYDRSLLGWSEDGVVHRRHITHSSWGDWMVADIVLKGRIKKASSFIHLHPDWEVEVIDDKSVLCSNGVRFVKIEGFEEEHVEDDTDEEIKVSLVKGGELPIQGWYFPDFGIARESYTIRFDYEVKPLDRFGYKIKDIPND